MTSLYFLLFLPLCTVVFYVLPERLRALFLAVVSLSFYAVFEPGLFFVLPFYIIIGYFGGLIFEKNRSTALLFVFVTVSVGVLCFFKYYGFFVDTEEVTLLLPLGISYFTFSTVGYLVDIGTNACKAERNFIRYALFIGFFPQLTAGPIARTDTLLPQLTKKRELDPEKMTRGLKLLAVGYFKKLCVAVPLGVFIAPIFASEESGGVVLFVAVVLYTFQLYFDFCGYTDIARGTAALFGLELAPNFKQPFYSTNFSAFWQRWHITLSKWLQDYIFTPIVWNKPLSKLPIIGKFWTGIPIYSTIFVLFVVSGLWHGAGLTFLVWGVLQAVYRIGEELLHKFVGKPKKKQGVVRLTLKRKVVFFLFAFSLIFFRAPDISTALDQIVRIFTVWDISLVDSIYNAVATGFNATPIVALGYIFFGLFSLAVAMFSDDRCFHNKCEEPELLSKTPTVRKWVIYYAFSAIIFAGFLLQNGGFGTSASFIYGGF